MRKHFKFANLANLTVIITVIAAIISVSAYAQVALTNPLSDQNFTTNSAITSVVFNFNITLGNETYDFTPDVANITNTTCLLNINSTTINDSFSGYTHDFLIGEYVWNVSCTAPNSTYDSVNNKFSIATLPLTLNATAMPTAGIAPLTVSFLANAFGGIPQYFFIWNFGDGVFSTFANMSYTYQNNGTYNATLKIKDSANQTIEKSFIINVQKPKNFTSTVVMDKLEYVVGENAHISINAPMNSTVQLRFFKNNIQIDSMDFVHSIPNSDYIYLLYSPYPVSTPGNYTMKAYITSDGVTNNHSVDFRLKTLDALLPLNANIIVDSTNVDAGHDISFRSSVSGGIPPYRYEWDTNNDGTVDSTNVDAMARFNVGNHTVKLTVKDSNNSQAQKTITINSREPTYRVIVTVADSYTNQLVENADVTFADNLKNTGSSGSVEYLLKGGNYTLKVSKADYHQHLQTFELKDDLSLTVKLNSTIARDIFTVDFLNPASSAGTDLTVKYKVNGVNPDCTIYFKEDGWWASKGKVSGAGEKEFTLGLSPGSYDYKIECVDAGTTISTEVRTVKISSDIVQTQSARSASSESSTNIDDIELIYDWIDEMIGTIENLGVKEKEAADAMNLLSLLQDKRKEVQRIDRDLADLKYLTGTQAQIEDRSRDLYAKLRTIKGEIPKAIEILDESEFVKYPREEDIKALFVELKRGNDTNSIENTLKIQSKISISTKVKKIIVSYYYADRRTMFIVEKNLEKKDNLQNYTLMEMIPKTLSKSTKEMTFVTPYTLVKEDPIVEINPSENEKIIYYFNSEGDIKDAENIKSILLEKNNVQSKKSNFAGLTGFSIKKLVPIKIEDTTLLLEVIAIIVLLIAYVFYNYSDEIKGILHIDSHDGKKMEYLRKLRGDIMQSIESNNLERAYLIYEEMKLMYKSLSPQDKGIVFDEISKIAHEINARHALSLIDESFDLLRAGAKEKAALNYGQVQQIYNALPENYKQLLQDKSVHLYEAITA